ncbi:Stage 0 sporulation protein J [uncultured Desulfobacterium sp.]|uniref:Stage 0 sporulation protein J n=1 Tax=uncultured Desulfobacterium sp. TaxID=201089 RepID=A0A445MVM8_9BACT|nr:Stage 0 sporulation protein J [uncultured Desulfobacterium sp.]
MSKRSALGKGLSALIPSAAESDTQFFLCPIELIEPNPYQPRQEFSAPELEEMVLSVKEKGVITPLLVTKTEKGYQLIAGERRWRAAQKAGLERVPVVVREVTPTESLELALIENIHRKDLNPIEEALAYNRLMEDTGLTQELIAKRLGKDRSTVTNILRLLKLPSFIQKDIIDGNIAMAHARVLAGIKNANELKRLRDAIISRGLSVRTLEAMARKINSPAPTRKKKKADDDYMESLAQTLKRALGTKVDIRKKGKEGRIIIYFFSDNELERLLERLA